MQSKGDNKELLIKQLPERQLDLGEVYVLDYEQDSHTTPKMTGVIVKGATNYQVIPVETFISGDAFEGVEEKYEVRDWIHRSYYVAEAVLRTKSGVLASSEHSLFSEHCWGHLNSVVRSCNLMSELNTLCFYYCDPCTCLCQLLFLNPRRLDNTARRYCHTDCHSWPRG